MNVVPAGISPDYEIEDNIVGLLVFIDRLKL
jgi:hypothetical protein